AAQLGAPEASVRAEAVSRLAALGPDDLPAIAARLRALAARRPQEDDYQSFARFRHATGSRRADDAVDIEPGVELTLEQHRDPLTLHFAELLLLARALERMGGLEAGRLLADVIGV